VAYNCYNAQSLNKIIYKIYKGADKVADKKSGKAATLTQKQIAWIDYFKQGYTATDAAKMAGYKGKNLHVIGSQNLTKLKEHLIDRDKVLETPRIADMVEINEFWTRVIRGEEKEEQAVYNPATGQVEETKVAPALKDRLKAAELRAKVQGAFVDNINHTGDISITVTVDEDE